MSEKDEGNIAAIVDAAGKIIWYAKDFLDADSLYADQRSFDAILMNFVIMGETVTKLSETTQLAHPKVPWSKIRGLRNIVAHDYFGVDAEEIWEIIQNHIPELQTDLQAILNKKSG